MFSKIELSTVENMCRERAALAQKEMEYWLGKQRNGSGLETPPSHRSRQFLCSLIGAHNQKPPTICHWIHEADVRLFVSGLLCSEKSRL